MDVIKIVTPEAKPGEFALPTMDVSAVKRKFLDIPYVPGGGNAQSLDIFLPDEGDGPFPTIIFIHGGAFWGGDKRDTQNIYLMNGIRRGYAVVNMNHRLSQEAKFPLPVYDVKAGVRFLRANAAKYCLDPDRFAVGGNSAGAYFAALLGTSADVAALEDYSMGNAGVSSRVQAAIGLFGVYDLTMQSQFTEDSPATGGFKMPNFADQFAEVLQGLDEIVMMPIYPAREKPILGVTSSMVLRKIPSMSKYLCTADQVLELIPALCPDVVLTLGAGDIDRLVPRLEATLREQILNE